MNKKESGEYKDVPKLYTKQWILNFIKTGQKTIDVRQEDLETTNIQVDHKLRFVSDKEIVTVIIVGIRKYNSIDEVLKSESLEKMLPGKNIQEAKQIANELFIKGKPLLAIEIKVEK